MSKSIGEQKVGSISVDTLLKTVRQIVSKETAPLYAKVSHLEAENRALRARLNATQGGTTTSQRFAPVRR